MAVKVFWDNDEKTIIRAVYEGKLSAEDYYRAIDQVVTMMKSVSHEVHNIYHREQIRSAPRNILQIMQYAHQRLPNNLGLRIVIGGNQVTRTFVNVGRVIAPHLTEGTYFVDSVAEAHHLIQKHLAERERAKA
ncbi:MAG: hypothetical protein MUF87_20325 [Anaerolineae bacterium]|jgi:hypothetical protein|nr:hypothetical protein [Anaerolineae bacterium]